jgi:hypothetical protein
MNFDFSDAGGYEYFEKDGNHIFTMAQWYPRLCMYNDVTGWQNQQFTGRESLQCFGDFKVKWRFRQIMLWVLQGVKNYEKC